MSAEPEWLKKVRAAHQAHIDAVKAIDAAFPEKSRWVYNDALVEVSPLGADFCDLGQIKVQLVDPPHWSRSVQVSCLKTVPEQPCPTPPPTESSSASTAGNTSGS